MQRISCVISKELFLLQILGFLQTTIKHHRDILTQFQECNAEGGEREMIFHLKKVEAYLLKKDVICRYGDDFE